MTNSLCLIWALVQVSLATPTGKVTIVAPKDQSVVTSPVKVKMKVEGLKLRPAGEDADDQTTGHHHVIIDAGPVEAGQVIPADQNHLHYGKAQTEAVINLTPGKHTLTLQFADGAHRSYGPALSQTIQITVK